VKAAHRAFFRFVSRVMVDSSEPEFALLYGPPLLFPFAVDKETHWSVELASEWAPGGAVLSHDDAIRVEYPRVADVLDVFAEVIEAGSFETVAEGRLVLSDEAERRGFELTRVAGIQ